MTRGISIWVHFYLFFLLTVSIQQRANAQEVSDNQVNSVYFNLNFSLGIPQQQFHDRLDAVGVGIGGNVIVDLPYFPLQIGLDGSYTGYERAKLDLEIDVGGFFEDFDLITRNNIVQMYGMIRFVPPVDYFLQPYVDGMIGTKLLYTRTRLINRDNSEEGVVETNTDQHDWSFSYGGAVGLQIHLLEYPEISVDLRCAYLLGNNASFLTKRVDADQLNLDETIDAFEEKRAPTHLLLPQIGISINLSSFEDYEE